MTRGRLPLVLVLAAALGVASALVLEPIVSEQLGRRAVESTFEELVLPSEWQPVGPPNTQTVERGGVLMSRLYSTPGGNPQTQTKRFVELTASKGWEPIGGAPDLTTIVLERDGITLSLVHLPNSTIRLEAGRYR